MGTPLSGIEGVHGLPIRLLNTCVAPVLLLSCRLPPTVFPTTVSGCDALVFRESNDKAVA
jgi:hypothetical protein